MIAVFDLYVLKCNQLLQVNHLHRFHGTFFLVFVRKKNEKIKIKFSIISFAVNICDFSLETLSIHKFLYRFVNQSTEFTVTNVYDIAVKFDAYL